MLYLTQYNFKVVYKERKENIEADTLSRNPALEDFENKEDCLEIVNMIKIEEIINDQESIKDEIKNAKKTFKNGDINFKILKNNKRIYVSKELGKKLIDKIHKFYGHIGNNQMAEKIRPFYYFKNMDQSIKDYCNTCETCIKNKSMGPREIGLLSKLGSAKYPFEIMSIDTIGGFGGHRSTKKYMHLLVDHFSRYAWISTSTTQSADDFIKLINPIINKNEI